MFITLRASFEIKHQHGYVLIKGPYLPMSDTFLRYHSASFFHDVVLEFRASLSLRLLQASLSKVSDWLSSTSVVKRISLSHTTHQKN